MLHFLKNKKVLLSYSVLFMTVLCFSFFTDNIQVENNLKNISALTQIQSLYTLPEPVSELPPILQGGIYSRLLAGTNCRRNIQRIDLLTDKSVPEKFPFIQSSVLINNT